MIDLNHGSGAALLRAMPWLTRPRRQAMGGWSALAIFVALVVSVPVFVVFGFVFVPAGEVWRHLADTVLVAYVVNTLWLVLGVGIGVLCGSHCGTNDW